MIVKDSSPGQPGLLEATTTTETIVPPYDPPEYISQSQFRVGKGVTTAPFVTPSQLKAHLGLLRAFRDLKLKVQDNSNPSNVFPPLAGALDPEARWVWFLELALERYVRFLRFAFSNELEMVALRFRRWVLALGVLRTLPTAVDNPPLDVWLVWHAYMLNPTYEKTLLSFTLKQIDQSGIYSGGTPKTLNAYPFWRSSRTSLSLSSIYW